MMSFPLAVALIKERVDQFNNQHEIDSNIYSPETFSYIAGYITAMHDGNLITKTTKKELQVNFAIDTNGSI